MSKLVWDQIGERLYETGTKKGVLYPYGNSGYETGVAWNGLTAVSENPSGAEATALYADDIKYLNLYSAEEYGYTIEAYTYPEEFEACDGSAELSSGVVIGQQARKAFGFSWQTVVGNDTEENDYGYKIHIAYGSKASPSEKSYASINDSPEAITFSWEVSTTPVNVTGHKPTASVTIDTTKIAQADADKLALLEEALYGVDATAFSATSKYAVGDCVTYENKTYRCKTAIATGAAWDASKWDEISNPEPHILLPDEIAAIFATQG